MLHDQESRDEKGRWLAGVSGNPSGKANGIFSADALKAIASHFLTSMTREELLALAENTEARRKLSTAQDLILTRILEASRRDSEGRLNFCEIMDRTAGRPRMTHDVNLQVDIATLFERAEMAQEAKRLEANNAPVIDAIPVPGELSLW